MKGHSKLRRTRIVCTIGPATSAADQIRQLILAGMDVARLNFSHGDHDTHRATLHMIRDISKELGKETGILQDLGGPKIRLGKLPGEERELRPDERVILSPMTGLDRSVIPVNYPYIVEDVAVGDRILLADGLVELKVEHKQADRIVCRVVVGGVVQSHKGVNLPTTHIRIPAFTDKDRDDLALGLEEGVDFVTLSFVSHERDLESVFRSHLDKYRCGEGSHDNVCCSCWQAHTEQQAGNGGNYKE